jgi:hypothetical protein
VLEGKLEPGNSFRWSTFGMTITSTVYALEAGSRILRGGKAGDIVGIHEWTFTETPSGGGWVCGVVTGDTTQWLGIPYAASPVGSLRWQPQLRVLEQCDG